MGQFPWYRKFRIASLTIAIARSVQKPAICLSTEPNHAARSVELPKFVESLGMISGCVIANGVVTI